LHRGAAASSIHRCSSTASAPPLHNDPVVRAVTPLRLEVEEGKTYFWCACGRTQTEPWCDGSHKITTIRPVKWVAPKSGTASICACRATRRPGRVLCDGSHAAVPLPPGTKAPE
jgi:CDGSH-type Zn-finger protein